MEFVDTHTHIFLNDFDSDRQSVIARAKEAGVKYMIMPNIDSASFDALIDVEAQYKGYCFPLMGLHPTSVNENFEKELAIVKTKLAVHKFSGIGEIGIDLYWDKTFLEQQKIAFRNQLKLAKALNLPVVIHSREAFDEILEIVDSEVDSSLKGVFHSFSGTLSHYERIVQYKTFMVGIGGVVTYKNGGVNLIVEHMDLHKILLETDSPYLSPVPLRGKRNESSNIIFIAQKVADIMKIPVKLVAEVTTKNAISIFSLE